MGKATPTQRGAGFFAIDRRIWGWLCDSGSLSEAAAYLVLAQGTGADNRYTSWSATSLKRYVGIAWERARASIEGLMAKGFIASAETSTRNKPRYELLSAAAVANAIFAAKEATLSDRERFVLRCIRDGRRASRRDFKIVASLESKGLVHHYAGTTVALKPPAAEEADPRAKTMANMRQMRIYHCLMRIFLPPPKPSLSDAADFLDNPFCQLLHRPELLPAT